MPFRLMKICLQKHNFKARLSFDQVLSSRWLGGAELPAVGMTLLLLLLLLSNSWFETPDLIIVCYNTPPNLLEKTSFHNWKFWVQYLCIVCCSFHSVHSWFDWHNISFRGSTLLCFEFSLVPFVGLFFHVLFWLEVNANLYKNTQTKLG